MNCRNQSQSIDKRLMSNADQVLNSIEQLAITESLARIIIKLPAETEEMIPDKIKDLISFRDFTSILNGFGLKVPRNRTKIDMISSILSFAGDYWPEIHRIAENILYRTTRNVPQAKSEVIPSQEDNKKTKMLNFSDERRRPFDSQLASLISQTYMSPRSNWKEIMDTVATDEAKKLETVFSAIIPETIPNNSISTRRDSLTMQFLAGQIRSTSHALDEFDVNFKKLNKFSEKVTMENADMTKHFYAFNWEIHDQK